MLAASGEAVCTSLQGLGEYLDECIEVEGIIQRRYGGFIE
jgi:hypothetical protein